MSIDKHPRLEKDPRPEVWEGWPGTVLPSDEITYYSTSPDISPGMHLIDPFEEEYLEAARYNLRLGSIVHVGGEPKTLDDSNPWLILEPHQSAVVQTFEEVRLPRFLIARWNLKVRMVYEGLLWTGSLQVDPGWHGRLVCPIYNLANRRVYLRYKKDIFAMDFVRTTLYKPGVSKPYEQKGQVSLEDYDIHRLQSAPYSVL
jgi:deoxycytidine triphosphate deaminase